MQIMGDYVFLKFMAWFSLIVMTYTFLLQRLTNSPNQTNITSVMMKNKQETIEKIKQAALEEFYANGYAKASLRTICRRAGVTKDSESVLKK